MEGIMKKRSFVLILLMLSSTQIFFGSSFLIYEQTVATSTAGAFAVLAEDPACPGTSRVAFSLGFGYTKDRLKIEVADQFEFSCLRAFPKRELNAPAFGWPALPWLQILNFEKFFLEV